MVGFEKNVDSESLSLSSKIEGTLEPRAVSPRGRADENFGGGCGGCVLVSCSLPKKLYGLFLLIKQKKV